MDPARLLIVVLIGNAELATVAVTLASVEETEAHAPAALPLRSVLSFVKRHGATTPTRKGDTRG